MCGRNLINMGTLLGDRTVSQQTYREQLARLVQHMTVPHRQEAVAGDLAAGSDASRVKMFVEGNLEKRLEKLESQLEFVAEAFDDFESLIIRYMRDCRLAAYDTGTSDGERMLTWLAETQTLTPEQLDYVACQRARHAVEQLARKNRLRHVGFQDLYTLAERTSQELGCNERLRVYLNPIRKWSRFVTGILLDDEATLPADVLFFPVGEEVSTAVLELEGQVLINELTDFQPCTLAEWAALSQQAGTDELIETCRDLSAMGLVAFG